MLKNLKIMIKLFNKLILLSLTSCLFIYFTSNINAQITTVDINHNKYGKGGSIDLYDENGDSNFIFGPEFIGEGGTFQVYNGLGGLCFYVKGNFNTSNNYSIISIVGNSNSIFKTSAFGDTSVTLPVDAVSNTERLDEVGLSNDLDPFHLFSSDHTNITSQTISAPAPGFILAIATVELELSHDFGSTQTGEIGLSSVSETLTGAQDIGVGLPALTPNGDFYQAATVHGIFEAVTGPNTIYLVGAETIGDGITCRENALSLIYIPTPYGSVTTDFSEEMEDDVRAIQSDNATEEELAVINKASIKANQDRIQKEIDDLKTLLQEYKSNNTLNK